MSPRAYEFWELFDEGVIAIKGPPGAGKTLLAARAASRFKNAAWFTFYETADRLRKYLKAVNIEPPAHIFRPGEHEERARHSVHRRQGAGAKAGNRCR